MKNQVLSIEQMKHLQELGVDTNGASMMYHFWVDKKYKNCLLLSADTTTPYDSENVPTFTLQDMLEMMPKKILIEMENDSCRSVEAFFLDVSLNICNDNWQCGYIHFSKREDYFCHKYENTDLLTCAYETLCWCAENGYLKGGEK